MKWLVIRIQGFIHYKELLLQLVTKDIKLKYRRSFLGYVWSVLNPLLIMLVMTLVFSQLFRFEIPNYAVYFLSGQVLFTFMSEATTMASGSIVQSAALLKKTYVPKYIFPVARVTSSLVNMAFSMIALAVVMIITGVIITPWILMFPLVLLQLYVFSLGLGLFLAQVTVFFRDIQYIYGVLTTAWTYLTPIIYPVEKLPDTIKGIVMYANPMYYYVAQFRDVILYGRPSEPYLIFAGVGAALVFLSLGLWSFKRKQDKFILYI